MAFGSSALAYDNGGASESGTSFRDRVIPQNIDAEKAVLAAMILDDEILDEALLEVHKEIFYRPSHQKIFEAIEELRRRDIPVDQISLAERLEAKGELESIGGKAYILELANNSFALANWQHHIQIIKRQHLLRSLISAATKISALSYDAPDDTSEIVEEAERQIFSVTDREVRTEFQSLSDLMKQSLISMEQLSKEKTHIQGVPTGFESVDRVLSGMRGGDLIILAARPGIGKTSFALNVAVNAAKSGAAVAFFSLEMPCEQLIQKIMCTEARVNLKKMRNGTLSTADWQQLIRACSSLDRLDFSIDDSSALKIMQLRAKARRQLRGKEKGLIVVDYLQLMQASGAYRERHLEVAEITRGLKILAKELNVPIIALSQLSRRSEDREGKRPQLSDLRESGSIEQDADVVIFIDRSINEDEAASPKRPDLGVAKIMIEKHRNGPTGIVDLAFVGEYTRFDELYHGPDEYVAEPEA
ncbi:MAG: replicative DNA helicase [Coriobacteriales bacterium]|jgi:replicative DNA helicase